MTEQIDDREQQRLARLLKQLRSISHFGGYPGGRLLNEAETVITERDYWRLRLLCEQVWELGCDDAKRVIGRVWKILGLKG